MSLHNYSCLNTREGTFIKHDGTLSYLDIAIISSNLSLGSDWYVHDDSVGSDHLPISVAINFSIHKEIPSQAHWNYKKSKIGKVLRLTVARLWSVFVADRLGWYMEKNQLFNRNQCSFRRGK